MKKILALLIAAMMLVSLAACAPKDDNGDTDENVNGTEDNIENNEGQENNDAVTPDDTDDTDDDTGDDAETPDDSTGDDAETPDSNTGSTDNNGSGSSGNSGSTGNGSSGDSGSSSAVDLATSPLTDIMASILANVADLPMVGEVELTSENFDFYAFTDYADGYEGLASDAMINAIAHSAVLVRVPDGTDVETVRADIEANANPAKWVCVNAEKTTVIANGNVILLVMSSTATTDAIAANFQAL